MNYNELLEAVIKYDAKVDINPVMYLIEEMTELTLAICRMERGRPDNIPEEMAQVRVMLDLIQKYLNLTDEDLEPHKKALLEDFESMVNSY